MCGFILKFALESASGDLISEFREDSLELLEKRGPDGRNTYANNKIRADFFRLKIRGLENGSQPVLTSSGHIGLANGEVYNSDELYALLPDDYKVNLDKRADIHVVVNYLVSTGMSSWGDIEGMFAMAIVTPQNELFLARDKTGQKPLFYFTDKTEIVVSSNFQSLLIEKAGDLELNTKELDQWLTLGSTSPGETLMHGIKEVLPGQVMRFSKNGSLGSLYWTWPKRGKFRPNIQEIRGKVNRAVKRCSISEVGVSLAYSGGEDSLTIKNELMSLGHKSITYYSLGFDNSDFDETKNSLDSDLNASIVFENEMNRKTIHDVIALMDEPISDPACLAFYLICKVARSNKSKVLVTGDGGDESTKGYEAFRFEAISNLAWVAIDLVPKSYRSRCIQYINKSPDNKYLSIKNKLTRFLVASLFPRHQRWGVAVSPNYFLAYLTGQFDKVRPPLANADNLETYFQNFVLPQIYLKKADRMSMGQGVEVRAPFLDSELIGELMKIRVKGRGHAPKPYSENMSLRKKKLKKHGLGVPLSFVLLQLEQPDWVLEILGLEPDYLNKVWVRRGNLSTGEAQALWSLYVLNEKIKLWKNYLEM